jgi:hypothetical protein
MQRMRRIMVAAIGGLIGLLVGASVTGPAVISGWKW